MRNFKSQPWPGRQTPRYGPSRPRRPRFHVHFTPTYSSWINQVERWLGQISQRAIRSGSFTGVTDFVRCIHAFTREYKQRADPFGRVASAQSVIGKIERSATRISDSPS